MRVPAWVLLLPILILAACSRESKSTDARAAASASASTTLPHAASPPPSGGQTPPGTASATAASARTTDDYPAPPQLGQDAEAMQMQLLAYLADGGSLDEALGRDGGKGPNAPTPSKK